MSQLPLDFPSDPNTSTNPIFSLDDSQPAQNNQEPPFSSTSAAFTLPDLDDDHSTLWCGVYALGRNIDSFVQHQIEEAKANRAALNAIVERLGLTSSSSTGGSSAPKFREPRVFNGRADQVDGFLREIENTIFLQCRSLSTDRDRVLYMGTFLGDGSPGIWYHTVQLNNAATGLLDNYPGFVNAFQQHFEQSDHYADALRKLGDLKQTGSAAAFTSRFLELTAWLDWTDQTKIQEYWNRLKDSVKATLINRRGRYFTTSFDVFAKECTAIDNELHQFELDRRSTKKTSASTSSQTQQPFHQPSPSTTTTTRKPDVVPMEIDAVRRSPLTNEEKACR
ncbi:hypothetical protein H1R20_g962, partial [Candolleomyces eurysporus]